MKLNDRQLNRLLAKLKLDPSGCILWTGAKTVGGCRTRVNHNPYGNFYVSRGCYRKVHRVLWEHVKEEILGQEWTLDHKRTCVSTLCCNLEHLEKVSNPENVARANRARGKKRA